MDRNDFDRDRRSRPIDHQQHESLSDCVRALEQRITELEAENTWLRHAAGSFGELAERFNALLQHRRGDTPGTLNDGSNRELNEH
jgi:hypothetical protein